MLVGVGLGPGDPDLMTIKAVETLKRADIIFVPGRLASDLVEPYGTPHILEFPMTRDKDILQSHWKHNADKVAEYARDGLAAFGLIGDPNFFSTFTHLSRIIKLRHPGIFIETIPGISSITAFASRTNISIDTSFQVSDGSPVNDRIILKARQPKKIVETLRLEGFSDFILAQRLFSDTEEIITNTEDMPDTGDYFSIIHARKQRD
jgi:precorrin-2/cobalt-factor-2 C20-methyltransferase